MKRDPTSAPFNFEAIPHWLEPELWDETKCVQHRGLKFIGLYTLSAAINSLIVFVPIFIYVGADGFKGVSVWWVIPMWWLLLSTPWGILIGLLSWWDFTRACRKLAKQKQKERG